jgi:cytochrome b6-f complex iron-sulfur subunit
MDRKDFIKTCGLACIGGVVISTLLEGCASSNYFAQTVFSNNQIIIKKSEFIKIDKDKTILRKYILVDTKVYNHPICVYKLDDKNYSALLLQCTHRSCELKPEGDYLICPCHGSEFTNKGVVIHAPAEENLQTFKIITDNENIYIQL